MVWSDRNIHVYEELSFSVTFKVTICFVFCPTFADLCIFLCLLIMAHFVHRLPSKRPNFICGFFFFFTFKGPLCVVFLVFKGIVGS